MCRDVVAGPTRREAAACRLLEHLARWCFQHRCPAPTCHPGHRCRNQVYTPAGEVGEGEEEAGGLVEALEGEQFVQEEHTS